MRTLIVVVSTLFLVASAAFAQQPPASHPMEMQPGHSMQHGDSGQMPADCQTMMQKMKSMESSQKAMDDRLEKLVGEMNKAKGSAKVDRMAAVIDEMVAQRKQMRDEMATMMPQMMGHMMEHMQSGMAAGKQSMMSCPMMSGSQHEAAAHEHKH